MLSVPDRSGQPPGHPSLHPSINLNTMNIRTSLAAVTCAVALTGFGTPVRAADASAADCFKPFTAQTKMLQFKAKKPPYRVALANGVIGNPVDLERHKGLREILDKEPEIKSVEVVGNWDDGTAQKAVADAIAVHGKFDGMTCQGGTTGAVRALIDAKNPFIPVAGEAENGFRKLIAEHAKDGLKGWSYGQSPALVAISLKAALAALQGNSLPQYISAPIPAVDYTNMKPGLDYFPDLSDDFFVASGFPQCNITLDSGKLMNAAKTSN